MDAYQSRAAILIAQSLHHRCNVTYEHSYPLEEALELECYDSYYDNYDNASEVCYVGTVNGQTWSVTLKGIP